MNERIKQIMDRAGTDTSGKWMSVDHAEHFAAMVIAECMSQCFSDAEAERIAKHFNIEIEKEADDAVDAR